MFTFHGDQLYHFSKYWVTEGNRVSFPGFHPENKNQSVNLPKRKVLT